MLFGYWFNFFKISIGWLTRGLSQKTYSQMASNTSTFKLLLCYFFPTWLIITMLLLMILIIFKRFKHTYSSKSFILCEIFPLAYNEWVSYFYCMVLLNWKGCLISFNFRFIYSYKFLSACILCILQCSWCSKVQQSLRSLESEVADGCERLVGARNWTQVLCKNSKYS